MPAERLRADAALEYAELVAGKAETTLVPAKLVFRLSQRYRVSAYAMRYRLTEYPVHVAEAVARSLKAQAGIAVRMIGGSEMEIRQCVQARGSDGEDYTVLSALALARAGGRRSPTAS
jgi:hypothetical protein